MGYIMEPSYIKHPLYLQAPIYTSFYDIHIKEWLKVFPREQIFIFRNEDYSKDIKGTFIQVFKFLDIGK